MQIKEWFLDVCEHHIGAVVLKEQYTVETSVFGAEFVALKQGIDALRGLRYKLRMMGIPIFMEQYISCTQYIKTRISSKKEKLLSFLSCSP